MAFPQQKTSSLARNAAFAVLPLAVVLVLTACLNDRNPLRAGQNGPLATPAIPHQTSLRDVNHAGGYCQAMDNCSACHGADLRGGNHGEPSCFKCHEAYWARSDCGRISHTANLGGVFHGRGYCRPYQECAACHGTNLQGGASGEPSCLKCHTQQKWMNCGSVPHNQTKKGVRHAAGACQPLSLCNACHGQNLQGGPNGEPSCWKCHGDYWTRADCGRLNHAANLGSVFHATDYCRPYQNCSGCHGDSLRGGAGGEPSCLKCHTQKKWMNCGSTQHNQSQDGVQHASGFCQPQANCTPCHGADLRGGKNSEPSCTRCHGEKWKESDCGHDD